MRMQQGSKPQLQSSNLCLIIKALNLVVKYILTSNGIIIIIILVGFE